MPEPQKKSTTTKTSVNKKKSGSKKIVKKVAPAKKVASKKATKSSAMTKRKKSKEIVVDVIEDDLDFEVSDKTTLSDFLDSSLSLDDKDKKLKNKEEKQEVGEIIEINELTEATFSSDIDSEDLDSQKKFFNELRLEVEKKESKKVNYSSEDEEVKDLLELFEEDDQDFKKSELAKKNRTLSLYSAFVWKFIGIVSLLLIFIFYFSFSKLVVEIVPTNEALNESLLLKVSDNFSGIKLLSDPRENVSGLVKEIKISTNNNFPATGEEYVGEDLSGRVKIINNYSRSQALVATTRLLSPDNKLFRIKEAVNVPPGGEVWVDIYTAEPSHEFAIKPTTFTIPGLWVGLQDKIYARSDEAFVFEQKKQKYVRASDISLAEKEIANQLISLLEKEIEKEKASLKAETGFELEHVYLQNGSNKISTEAKVDDKKDSFLSKGEASFVVAFFSKEESEKLAQAKLSLLVPSGKELLNFDTSSIIYNLEAYDLGDNSATVKSTFTGRMMLKANAEVVRKENLVGLSVDQLNTYLKNQPEIKSFELKFRPSFIKKAPNLVDRIKINIVADK